MLADIFVTTTNRADLLRRSLESLRDCTDKNLYRLTIVRDGAFVVSAHVLEDFQDIIDYTIVHKENEGLGPAINHALSFIDSTNRYYQDPRTPDLDKVAPFICYNQDDLLFTDGWLEILAKRFTLFETQYRLGFASGVECIEHNEDLKKIGKQILLKRYIRAAQMFARREYWMSMFPISRFDHETQNVRAKPNDGIGSGVDWHFIRVHENSVEKTGKTCLVIPGLVVHAGYKNSTWLKRELPESDADKTFVNQYMRTVESNDE